MPALTPLTLEGLVRLANGVLLEQEQLAERVAREVALDVFLLVDDGRGQGLLVRLSLEDLLFDCPSRDKTIYEA